MTAATEPSPLGWLGILRLGLVQASLGSVVVLVTSTLNRVMVVEYALPALLPGVLVAMHYAVQMIRPKFGHGSDRGSRRTPWIVGGMAVLAVGGILCSVATTLMSGHFPLALVLAVAGYAAVGLGVGAAGTSLLVLLAKRVDDRRRAAAATVVWILMIAGFAVTSILVGHFLDPYSPQRLVRVTGVAAGTAFVVAMAALWNVERSDACVAGRSAGETGTEIPFASALRKVWAEPPVRRFTMFVFLSMLAYSAQELLLEPFCGLVFGYSVGASATLSGLWHASALAGMIAIGIACSGTRRLGSLRGWTIGGCCASAAALVSLAGAGIVGPSWPLRLSVMALGIANGVFAVAAIGSMMELAARGEARNAGVRMGLWGAAQAVAFALGGFMGTAIVDGMRWWLGSSTAAFAVVFLIEAALFLTAAGVAARIETKDRRRSASNLPAVTV